MDSCCQSRKDACKTVGENCLLGSSFNSAINMVIIGAVSRFKSGQSTPAERAFVMTWILVGSMFGGILFPIMQKMSAILKGVKLKKARSQAITAFCTLLFWAILFI